MFTAALLLLLAALLPLGVAFDVRLGSAATLLKAYEIRRAEEVESSGLFVRRGVLFPYEVFETGSRESSAPEAKSYLMVKLPYELLAESFELQNRSLSHVNEYQILHRRIPEIALFEGRPNEYLEFIRPDPSLRSAQFIIKNSSAENRQVGAYTLNFYSLRLTKYLERVIKWAQSERRSALKKELVSQTLASDEHFNETVLRESEQEENEFILTKFVDNEQNYQTLYAVEMFTLEMVREISAETLWSAKYDGFSIHFASVAAAGKEAKGKGEGEGSFIDLLIVVSREGQVKRTQHVKEPLEYLNLSTIKHLELCASSEKLKLAIADNRSIYLIDVSRHLWALDSYKNGEKF